MNILYDKDHYKIALGQMNMIRHLIDGYVAEAPFEIVLGSYVCIFPN